ncbi:unnamed protein product [Protopolystoma xenopodis]|uniref:Gelsolin-like domain-containing protein n=1 Tax=Protopolystoma xenopodis TaxID=117903 RepID=A0A3S5AAR4_9PLAT|nr:unnamed protein product [Protopolystoma xenopodis]
MHIVSMPVHPLSLDIKFVYLLDSQSQLHLWLGMQSRLMIQTKGRLLAERISMKERRGEAEIRIETPGRESNEFWAILTGRWMPAPLPNPTLINDQKTTASHKENFTTPLSESRAPRGSSMPVSSVSSSTDTGATSSIDSKTNPISSLSTTTMNSNSSSSSNANISGPSLTSSHSDSKAPSPGLQSLTTAATKSNPPLPTSVASHMEIIRRQHPPAPEISPPAFGPRDFIPLDWKLPRTIVYDIRLGRGYLEMPQFKLGRD